MNRYVSYCIRKKISKFPQQRISWSKSTCKTNTVKIPMELFGWSSPRYDKQLTYKYHEFCCFSTGKKHLHPHLHLHLYSLYTSNFQAKKKHTPGGALELDTALPKESNQPSYPFLIGENTKSKKKHGDHSTSQNLKFRTSNSKSFEKELLGRHRNELFFFPFIFVVAAEFGSQDFERRYPMPYYSWTKNHPAVSTWFKHCNRWDTDLISWKNPKDQWMFQQVPNKGEHRYFLQDKPDKLKWKDCISEGKKDALIIWFAWSLLPDGWLNCSEACYILSQICTSPFIMRFTVHTLVSKSVQQF